MNTNQGEVRHQEVLNRLFKHLNSFKVQRPELLDHLTLVMQPKYYVSGELLFTPERIFSRSFYVSSGYVIVYTITEAGLKQVLRIYNSNSIVSLKSFDEQSRSVFYVWAAPGTYLLSVALKDMQRVYELFPETQELARLILGDWDERELMRLTWLNQEAIPLVEQFYLRYEEFLRKKVLSDADIASYLLISMSSLRSARTILLRTGRLLIK